MTVIQQLTPTGWADITVDHKPEGAATQLVDYITGNPGEQFRVRPEGPLQFGARLEFSPRFDLEPLEVTVWGAPGNLWVDEQTLRALLTHSFASDVLWNDPNRWWTFEEGMVVTVDTDSGTVQLWRSSGFQPHSASGSKHQRWCLTANDGRELRSLGIVSIHIHEKQGDQS